jgi:23S rRNA (cytosine1962-C5)-methyltransferase
MQRIPQRVVLKKNEDRRILAGHKWVFSNELTELPKDIEAGSVIRLESQSGRHLGVGYYNPNSLIAFRLLSSKDEEATPKLYETKISEALELRQHLYPESLTNAFRLVHSESDGLPGLVIDKFADVFSVQTFSVGADKALGVITDILKKKFKPRAIVERNESPLRELENLPQQKNILSGDLTGPVEIYDGDVKYLIDVLNGHKTGFFLDQRENRRAIRPFVKGKSVLDVFTSDGGFALNAAKAGASSVLAIDSSAEALARTRANATHNGLAIETLQADAFDALKKLADDKKQFDVVLLDPPSFTKSKKNLDTALRAYRDLNTLGLRLVKSGGTFATSSCSHHASEEDFASAVHRGSLEARQEMQLLYKTGAAPDHPVLLAMPETKYLKFMLFHVK